MENKKVKFDMKKVTSFISRSSKQFLVYLLEDHPDRKKEEEILMQRLNVALTNNSLVVLYLQPDSHVQKFESLSGFVASSSFQKGTLLLKPLKKEEAIRLIPVQQIKKIAMLQTTGTKAANGTK